MKNCLSVKRFFIHIFFSKLKPPKRSRLKTVQMFSFWLKVKTQSHCSYGTNWMSGGFTSNVKGISIKKIRKKLASSRKFWNDSEIMFFLQFKVFSENRNSKLQSFWSLMHSNHWSYKPYKPHVLWCTALCTHRQECIIHWSPI